MVIRSSPCRRSDVFAVNVEDVLREAALQHCSESAGVNVLVVLARLQASAVRC
jgi:hypothetical protein